MDTSKMKKSADPSLKDCATCETVGAKLTCAKCKATHYCSKACQKQHWKNGHKTLCVTPEERRPRMMASAVGKSHQGDNSVECPICLESISGGTLCTLPCKHDFHRECVDDLRKQGVQQACPLCRTLLPPGPQQLFEDATCLYVRIVARHRAAGDSGIPLATSEEEIMAQIINMWTNAANQGHAHAQYKLGCIYFTGSGVAQDYKKAVQWNHKAAVQGLAEAQCDLGYLYNDGLGVAKDHKKAMQWLRKAAFQGYADAQIKLGSAYEGILEVGLEVAQDHKKAVQWYLKAADQGCADAQYNVGVKYLNGEGVDQDYNEAVRWFRKAANQGFTYAQFNLGNMYHYGLGVAQDDNEAVQWHRKAADQGFADAQSSLGHKYFNGEVFAQNYNEAVRWFRKAADQGFAEAQFNLGNLYSYGLGVSQDDNEAVQLYRKAADQGYAMAQFNLGAIYYRGKGVAQDLKLAFFFISAAEAQGVKGAHDLRKKIEAALRLTSSECSDLDASCPSKCTSCGCEAKNDVQLKPCPRCKGPLYCGKDCQGNHWKNGHKDFCTKK